MCRFTVHTNVDSRYALCARRSALANWKHSQPHLKNDSSDRDLPYEVGLSITYGMDADEALKAMTINPAKMFGVDRDVGSIEVGKVANVIVTTGDPIDIRTLIKEVFVKGQRQKFDDRHTELYEKYKARPKPPGK